ncbi:unnamed protein product, partial [Symbiodinium sp. CCMP2592]
VLGLLVSGNDQANEDRSEHDQVLSRFAELGYVTVFKKVCSSGCGIPMTRRRAHYQLLDSKAVTNAPAQMLRLASVWDEVMKGQYKHRSLDEFLVPPTSTYFKKCQAQLKQQDPDPAVPEAARWKLMHAKIFQEHE